MARSSKALSSFLGLASIVCCAASPAARAADDDLFRPADLARIADVGEPAMSPDGNYVVYTVTTTNAEADERYADLWRVRYDGTGRTQLTFTRDAGETHPQWSPDGRSIAFLASRGGEEATQQVWLLPSGGGEARKLTDFPGGVDDYAWSPDGTRLAVIAEDPERAPGAARPKKPPPIVIDRFHFKEDFTGYLAGRRSHLYVFDLAQSQATLLTPGEHDEYLPAWSPDSRTIAYVTRRGENADRGLNYDLYLVEARAGAAERQLTHFPGSDLDPYWESGPEWSPDGKHIAYLRSGEDRWIYYAPWQLAVVDVAPGEETVPAPIDRCFTKPHWASDGKSIFALVEQSRVTNLARITWPGGKLTTLDPAPRFDFDFDVGPHDRIVVLGNDDRRPYELAAVEHGKLRALSDHNAWLGSKRLATVEDVTYRSRDGTPIDGFVVKPPDYQPGRKYPTLLLLHGGPVYQFSREFMPDWQAYAAAGYLLVAPNPRGSSGRGFDFARPIYADWGHLDVQDVIAGVDYAIAQGLTDPARLGVGGRSYGGILTNYVIASDTRFKGAVSGAGSSNFLGMYGHDEYTSEYELELGRPWEKPEVYERLSYPFLHADRIKTATLFYCEALDVNVPCLGAEQMYQALRSLRVPAQLVIYPGEWHPVTVPSYLEDRMTRMLAWYAKYVKP